MPSVGPAVSARAGEYPAIGARCTPRLQDGTWSTVSHSILAPDRVQASSRGLPDATVARLPVYHRVLCALAQAGRQTVSSGDLAAACQVTSALLRKDLSYLGSLGTRGVGYDVASLAYRIGCALGLTHPRHILIVGLGSLGHALACYGGLADRGFILVGAVDANPELIGTRVGRPGHDVTIRPIGALDSVVRETDAHIGIIATPAEAAQGVCDRLVAAGIRSILNFAPVVLTTLPGVEVRKVDLSLELQILAFHEQRRGEEPLPAAMRA